MCKFFLLLFCSTLITVGYAQDASHTYTLSGSINSDTGRMILYPVRPDSSYYPYHDQMETKVVDGKFIFTDSIDYPTAYILVLQKSSSGGYVSGVFFVDTGLQAISCNVDSSRVSPKLLNNPMAEFRKKFSRALTGVSNEVAKVFQKKDSLRKAFGGKIPDSLALPLAMKYDSLGHAYNLVLLHYAEDNPDSYIPMWWLIYTIRDYEPIYDTIYSRFSISVQGTTTGKKLKEALRNSGTVAIGKKFPLLRLLDGNYSPVTIPNLKNKNKYTLIDFWFSHCGACIAQFPKLKKLQSQYKNNDFGIVGVSVDRTKDLDAWKSTIRDKGLDWAQYWDKDAKCAEHTLLITGYPTNYLLDENGVIVRKNIDLNDLDILLSKLK